MSNYNSQIGTKVIIEAKVFRAKEKPKLVPEILWKFLLSRRVRGTGRWENLGEIVNKNINI